MGNNPIRFTDPLGLAPPANIPPGVDFQQNIANTSKMSVFDFYNAVKTGGPWDYKQQGSQYEDFGNYNYGLTGSAAGFSAYTLLEAAGAYQIYSGTSKPEWSWPGGTWPYGDDPNDQKWILEGINDYNSSYYKIKPGICH